MIPKSVYFNDTTAHTPLDIANLFNTFFNSVLTKSDYSLPPLDSLPSPESQLSFISISSLDVYSTLSELNPNKAPGTDDVHPAILKMCAGPLLRPITNLLSNCITYHIIPKEWKCHKICPIFKSGDPSCVSNYRPISLLCILSKILESLVYKKIILFIKPLISNCQFGFQQQRSCLTQLLLSFTEIYNAIHSKNSVHAVYLDFKKAFNTVPHQELLYKLWITGITGPLWKWFKYYLSDRER